MNIISQLHESFKNGKAETSSEWSKVLMITSSTQNTDKNTVALVEPLSRKVPGNFVVINTYINNGQLHLRVANITDEDVWLQLNTWIDIKDVEDTKNSIYFKRVSVNEEVVFFRESTTEDKQEQPSMCPIDFSNVDCTPVQKKLKTLFEKQVS